MNMNMNYSYLSASPRVRAVARGVWSMGASSKLLDNLDKVRIFAGKVKLLGEAISDGRAKAVPESRDLIDIRPVLSLCLIQNAFKLSNISWNRVCALLKREQLIFRLL